MQKKEETRTRFGSLEFGVQVEDRADPWTRWVYAGPNRPVAPISDPYLMFEKMYGQLSDQENLKSILDSLKSELKQVQSLVSKEDRHLLEEHESFIREFEQELWDSEANRKYEPTQLQAGVKNINDNVPQLSKMQLQLFHHYGQLLSHTHPLIFLEKYNL